MISYKNFAAEVKKTGLAVQNRFELLIATPAMFAGNNELVSVLCKSFNLPGVNIVTAPEKIIGESIEIPYDRTFSDATLTVWVDSKFNTRDYFERWVQAIQNYDSRILKYYDEYVSKEVTVKVLDKAEKARYSVVLYDAHPKSIGPLSLDNENPALMSFDVTMGYHYYKMKTV